MISFLKGDIVEVNVDYVLIDVNGVGFQVFVGKPQDFSYGRSLIYTYYHVQSFLIMQNITQLSNCT